MSKRLQVLSLEDNEVPVKRLSAQEELRLEQLEKVIVENFQTFVQVGQALAEIRERKLYRVKELTFEKYCKELFDIAKSRAYELISAAEVVQNVRHGGHFEGGSEKFLPLNERQVRPLAKLNPDQQISVWQAVVESAPQGKITANHVNSVVKNFLGEKIKTTVQRTQSDAVVHCSAEFSDTFRAFSDQIVKERNAGYKQTSRGFIVRALDQLRADMAEDGEAIEDNILHGEASDLNKLEKAGFSLFRSDRASMTIRTRSDKGGWQKYSGPFDTLKDMDAEFKAILQDDMHLRG